ncbi:MAG: MFS transporter, partial [Actinomycetota bacterium]
MTDRLRAALRRIAIDVAPFRVSRPFRRLWIGLAVSEFGYQFTIVATFVQVNALTGSPAAVGLIGLVGLVGLVAGTLLGSAFLDHHDRRAILLVAQVGFMVGAAVLLAGALLGDPPLVLIYGAVALIAFVSAVDSPTRSAMTPRLVGHDLLPAAITLNQVVWNGTALLGPAVAGVVIARFDVAAAYAIDLVTYVAMLWAAFLLPEMEPERREDARRGWAAVAEGFRFLRGRPVIQSTFTVDLIAMVFGMPRALFPILAATQFDRGAEVVGLLFAAPAIGALAGALTAGWVGGVRRQGAAVLWAVVLWGAGIAAFGLVGDNLPLALLLLAF